MPQIFRLGEYLIYFWSNENDPLEPIHVHVSTGTPSAKSTKIWITKDGHSLLCNNNSHIPDRTLRTIMQVIEARHMEIINKWYNYFGNISYYC